MATRAPLTLSRRRRLARLGGSRGNEILTSATAVVLIALIAVQLMTVLALDSLIRVHLFVGVVLLGPLALKLGSTGWRFLRYYTGSPEYRAKGAPTTVLRVTAPVFVAATIGLFGTGVIMLLGGQGEGAARGVHVTSFWVWLACLGLHVLLNGRQVLRDIRGEWLPRARLRIAGAEVRTGLVLASILGGVLVALSVLSKITGYDFGGD